jgi:site-specific DNA-methyltransferase (adenine-specific)
MKPYYEHAGITIYHGDCREILPGLSADAIVTDPPYGTGWVRGGGAVGQFSPCHSKPEWDVFTVDWLGLPIVRAYAVFGPVNRQVEICRQISGSAVLYYRKTNPQPLGPTREAIVCKPSPWWMPSWEFSAYNGDNSLHPCQKPRELMVWLIAGLQFASIIDPFMGSGTSLEASKLCGIPAIGIEIEEKYCEIAAKRLSQEVFNFEATA